MRLPISLIWFALTAVIFLLQWIPWTGIFLMLLLAPFWSVVTVNLGFVSLAVEALIGKTSKLWLLAPIVWFGGYALFTSESHRALDEIERDVRAYNARQSVAFSPTAQALVFADENGELANAASRFVYSHGLSVTYVENRRDTRRKPKVGELPKQDVAQFMATRLGAGDLCNRLKDDARLRAAGIYVSPFQALGKVASGSPGPMCSYRVPENPTLPIVRVAAKTSNMRPWTHELKSTEITITADNSAPVTLKAGYGSAYTWWPMPVAGCYLNSGAPSWKCDAGFMTERPRGLGRELGPSGYTDATLGVISDAFKLKERPIAERYGEIEAGGAAQLETALEAIAAQAVASLDQVLAQPELKAKYDSFKGLTARPDILAPRADAIVSAMSQALDSAGYSETPQHLQALLAALPDADFTRIAPKLVAALERERPTPRARKKAMLPAIERTLLVRLGDLGEVGLPVLEPRALGAGENASADAILGLCRAGVFAAHLGDPLALAIEAVKFGQDAHRAGVVALLRFGRPDLVETIMAAAKAEALQPVETTKPTRRSQGIDRQLKDYEAWLGAITPNSPPTVCQRNPLKP